MSLYSRIISLLNQHGVTFEEFTHAPVFTSAEAASVRGIDIKQGAKSMVVLADREPLLLVVSGAKRIDTKKFKRLLNIRDLRFATKEEVLTLTGVTAGAVPPFGSLMNMNVFVDYDLEECVKIAFNAGDHTKSIMMLFSDFVALERPTLCNFSR